MKRNISENDPQLDLRKKQDNFPLVFRKQVIPTMGGYSIFGSRYRTFSNDHLEASQIFQWTFETNGSKKLYFVDAGSNDHFTLSHLVS